LEIHNLPAYELAEKIKNKEISSLEVTELFIERIEKYDDDINAVVIRTFDEALMQLKRWIIKNLMIRMVLFMEFP